MFNPFGKSARQRRQSTIGAAVFGGLLTLAAFPTLFMNEGRAVKTARALTEGAAAVVTVDANQVDPAHDDKLVHFSGEASTDETLTDDRFGVSKNAIRLLRSIEIYQWKEIEEKVTREVDGKSTTQTKYAYEKTWDSKLHSSSKFQNPEGHQNPAAPRFAARTFEAKDVMVGQYRLSQDLVSRITAAEPLDVSLLNVPEEIAGNLRVDGGTETSAAGFYWSANPNQAEADTTVLESSELQLKESVVRETDSTEPEIGDMRIRFSATPFEVVSVIAQQAGTTLKPYKTNNGRTLGMLSSGNMDADVMFDNAQAANSAFTWALRVAGTVLLIFGIGMVLSPLTSMTDRIPIVGNLVGMGAAMTSVLLGGAIAILIISSAWLFYRPLVAIPMIVIGVGMLVLLAKLGNKQVQQAQVHPIADDDEIRIV